MKNKVEVNTYNIKAITALNDYLKDLKTSEEIFNHIEEYLRKDYGIKRLQINVDDRKLFANFDYDEKLLEKAFKTKIGKDIFLTITLFYYENEQNEIDLSFTFIKTLFDIISQTVYNKCLENRLEKLSVIDPTTGLYNRQFIDEYLHSVLPLTNREKKKIAFLKVGIDHFKAVIDEFDYKTGDKVLQTLAKNLKDTIRESDVVARIESDEFLIILNNIINEDNAIMVASKVIDNFKNEKVLVNEDTNQTLMKTICTGISIYPDDASEIDEIFRSSDIALYEARNKGRSQYFKFQKEAESIELF